jgi:hypothetical protein
MAYRWLPPSKNHKPLWEGKMVDRIELENGLTLEIWDYSRRLAGDRWLVGLLIQVGVCPKKEDFANETYYNLFMEKTDGKVYYRYRKERHFVPEDQINQLFSTMKEGFLTVALPYLSHPEFKERLIKHEVDLFQKKMDWERSIQEKDAETERLEELWKEKNIY